MELDSFKNELSSMKKNIQSEKEIAQEMAQRKEAQLKDGAKTVLTQMLPLIFDEVKAFVSECETYNENYGIVSKKIPVDLLQLNNVLNLPESWKNGFKETMNENRRWKSGMYHGYENIAVLELYWDYLSAELAELTGIPLKKRSDTGAHFGLSLKSEEYGLFKKKSRYTGEAHIVMSRYYG